MNREYENFPPGTLVVDAYPEKWSYLGTKKIGFVIAESLQYADCILILHDGILMELHVTNFTKLMP